MMQNSKQETIKHSSELNLSISIERFVMSMDDRAMYISFRPGVRCPFPRNDVTLTNISEHRDHYRLRAGSKIALDVRPIKILKFSKRCTYIYMYSIKMLLRLFPFVAAHTWPVFRGLLS